MKSLIDYPQEPLSEDNTKILIVLVRQEFTEESLPERFKKEPYYLMIANRLQNHTVSEHLIMFLACICDRPGSCTLWAYTVTKLKEKTLEGFCLEFGDGIPNKESMQDCWEAQKGEGPLGNLLDKQEVWS